MLGATSMRVLFLTEGDTSDPSARVRVYHLVPGLAALGIEARVLPPTARAGPAGKARMLREAVWADVVVLQRVLAPRPLVALLARVNPAVVFDFDDALYAFSPLRERLSAVLELATEVVAGSEELARYARRRSRSVTVVPTVVDPASYRPAAGPANGDPLRIGWIGTTGNLPFLELIRSALGEVVRRGAAIDFRVICSSFPRWPELAVTQVPWRIGGAEDDLAELDVGVAPLPDTPLTRGKCGLKAIQYMAAALPVVATPVGALGEIVLDGETGFLAAGELDWIHRLEQLVGDEELRRRLGAAGRRRVEERYSVSVAVPALAAVLERAAATVRRRAA
jgi:glycosyltransferase involved in cell wall biosynthesis